MAEKTLTFYSFNKLTLPNQKQLTNTHELQRGNKELPTEVR